MTNNPYFDPGKIDFDKAYKYNALSTIAKFIQDELDRHAGYAMRTYGHDPAKPITAEFEKLYQEFNDRARVAYEEAYGGLRGQKDQG